MAWDHLSWDRPHLAYAIIGGFTSLFMLCSLFVKEKMYIGEATVATICGIIFGPHAANLFDPISWGNVDKLTLELSRIVLVVQCFAVGVELPKSYMERHWKSVTFLLIPVMTFGWLITSLFVWWMIEPLTWLESLAVAACVTATDPVLASSVVGKGKFAKRVPKHLRDLLSAESGCNDGMAFPFVYLALYLIQYHIDARETVLHWFCVTVLYECIFGAIYGFTIGYIGRHLIKLAHRKDLIDRESFLVFYFVLALFCAGTGAGLGMDDLLVGFAAGVGFSNDGWFTQKTEESHVSNVIDLLINLSYFVFFGAIVPWDQFNNPALGLTPWRLVVIAIFVLFFRRIPIMLALKPIIPDVKNWREALFAGHFGPIGVGAIFVAILARAELETESTQPLAVLPEPGTENYFVVQIIWPVVTFLVITSILVHGSSIAVFTLGKRINTLSLTMSYTQANEPSWLNRLPRIASTSKSMSKSKADYDSSDESDDRLPQFPPGTLPPVGYPGGFLRRQKEEEGATSRASSRGAARNRKKWDSGLGPGGPISQSAIAPQRRSEPTTPLNEKGSEGEPEDAIEMREDIEKREKKQEREHAADERPEVEAYEEGDHMIVEDEEGNVLRDYPTRGRSKGDIQEEIEHEKNFLEHDTSGEHAKNRYHPHEKNEGEEIEKEVVEDAEHPEKAARTLRSRLGEWNGWKEKLTKSKDPEPEQEARRRGPAHAYQYGNTIIVEDEDGEVVKKYDIPARDRKASKTDGPPGRMGIKRMSTWTGFGGASSNKKGDDEKPKVEEENAEDDDDARIRFTVGGSSRRMSKQDFIKQIQSMDPKARIEAIDEADASDGLKRDVKEKTSGKNTPTRPKPAHTGSMAARNVVHETRAPARRRESSTTASPAAAQVTKGGGNDGTSGLTLTDSHGDDIPVHAVGETVGKYSSQGETAAERRRREARAQSQSQPRIQEDSDDDGTERVPPGRPVAHSRPGSSSKSPEPARGKNNNSSSGKAGRDDAGDDEYQETAAEKRRRLAALGTGDAGADSDSDEDGGDRVPTKGHEPVQEPIAPTGIRFAESSMPRTATGGGAGRVQWGESVKGGSKGKGA